MFRKISILASVSVAVLASCSVAFADEMQAAATPAAEQAQAGDASSTSVTEVVVTGLRKSLQSAEAIKQKSVQQVDAIVAEDIGKLPDITVSDTAARIPGIQVSRADGEAYNVLIRGLPNFTTTYDGREIFTAEARLVALEDFPAAAIGAIEAYKTTTADMVEGGLAGELNVQSRRPFDFAGLEVAGMAWAQYETRSQNYDPNGNLLISDRWHTDLGDFGALLGMSYTRLRYLDSTRSNTDWVANDPIGPGGANVRFPDIQRIDYNVGDRERPSVNAALQWRPAQGLEFYADALWQGYRNKVSDRELTVPLWAPGIATYSNVVTQGTGPNPPVESLTMTAPADGPDRPWSWQGATYNQTDTYQFAVGGKYDVDRFHVSADIAHTQSRFLDSIYSMDRSFAAGQTVTANTGINGLSQGPVFHFAPGFDPTNPANWVYQGFFDRQLIAEGKDWQARLDLAYDRPLPFLTRLEAGFRFVDRDAHKEDGSRYDYKLPQNLPLSAVPGVSYAVFHSGFPSGEPVGAPVWVAPTYDSIRANIAKIRAFSGWANSPPPADPTNTFTATEKSYAGYAQAKYAFDLGVPVDGAVGVRVVGTDMGVGSAGVSNGVLTPTHLNVNYTDVLPNLMGRVHFTDKLQLRLSATETRTRPDFYQYDPAIFIPQPQPCMMPGSGVAPGDPSCVRYGNSGNAALKPLTSKNYDASLEYYFSRSGFASLAVFRHDLNGFISNYNVKTTDPQGYILFLNEPFNTGKGQITGFELQGQTFMDWGPAWLKPFGVQANVTYLDPKTGVPATLGGTISQTDIVGVSKWTYNLAGFYEGNGVAARLSWNYRSSYLSRFEYRGADPYSETTDGIGRLDFSSTYDLTPKVKLMFDATNLLGDPDVSYLHWGFNGGKDPATFPRAIHYTEQVISLGLRFAF